MKLSNLTDEELVQFYIQAISFYKVKTFLINNVEIVIKNISELEEEMIRRSSDYWNDTIQKVKNKLSKST